MNVGEKFGNVSVFGVKEGIAMEFVESRGTEKSESEKNLENDKKEKWNRRN